MHEIVVLGAGYAGLAAAMSLAGRTRRRADLRITLVNAGERFTQRLRLHQVATGQDVVGPLISEMIEDTGIEFVEGWVTGIDTTERTIRVDDERVLGYDTLVYALGSVADTVPGVEAHAYTFNSHNDAELLSRRLAGAGTVVVCGSGLTGVEAATEIAERDAGSEVVLLGRDEPGAELGERARAHLRGALDRLGVRVRHGVEIVKVLPDAVELTGGELVDADAVLWTAGVRAGEVAAAAGLAVDERGRIVTDGTLRSTSHPEVYAIGDTAAIRQGFGVLHGTCQSGMPTGAYAARNIARQLNGKQPNPFRFGYLHIPVSLGRNDAIVQFTRPDGSPRRWHLTGKTAAWYKETVTASGLSSIAWLFKNPGIGMFAWHRGGRYTR